MSRQKNAEFVQKISLKIKKFSFSEFSTFSHTKPKKRSFEVSNEKSYHFMLPSAVRLLDKVHGVKFTTKTEAETSQELCII